MAIQFETPPIQVQDLETTWTKNNPRTGEPMGTWPCSSMADVMESVQRARDLKALWKKLSLTQRACVLRRMADWLLDHQGEIAQCIVGETGKPVNEALEMDLLVSVTILRYMADCGPKVLADRLLPADKSWLLGRLSWLTRCPKGVVGVISPWNYPLAIPMGSVGAALMGGNTVLLKPSEETPETGRWIVRCVQESVRTELGEKTPLVDVCQGLYGPGALGQALLEVPGVDHIAFTGSTSVGRHIQFLGAQHGKTVSLELGGQDPAIVLPSAKAKLETVASQIVWGRCVNGGQSCAAVKKVLVHQTVYEPLLALIQDKMSRLTYATDEEDGHIGPLISQKQFQGVQEAVYLAIAEGATVWTPEHISENMPKSGYYYPPTLLLDLKAEASVLNLEIFGPVLSIVPFHTMDEALAMAHQSPYGLGVSLFGDVSQCREWVPHLQYGLVAINDLPLTQYAICSCPWSGWKGSGPGVSHGEDGLLACTQPQSVTMDWAQGFGLFAKPSWFFSLRPDQPQLSRGMLNTFGRGLLGRLPRLPGLLIQMWTHRSHTKL